ncbi:hypothetical protein [Sphingobium cupriresistens]|uniref:Uncharacterized protein n=1 Tax=Sphingobium cupriresistens LL01 TaxID=1420583 RepID=A0A0J7Y486_9SPHN|nr:hypothetical protein [Sphingobium cupriresistens]KMS58736.1 hypothetical protein V473_05345 [Sphingobium cupriresistens LL01]
MTVDGRNLFDVGELAAGGQYRKVMSDVGLTATEPAIPSPRHGAGSTLRQQPHHLAGRP